jgi:hypothetical protein
MTEISAKFLPFAPFSRNFARNIGESFALAREIYSIFFGRNKGFLKRNTGLGQAGGEHQIVKAFQDEAIPAALRRKIPEAQELLLAESKGVLRRDLREAYDAGSAYPFEARAKAAEAAGELTKSAKKKPIAACCLGKNRIAKGKVRRWFGGRRGER